MGAYNFTEQRKKVYRLYAEGKFFRDIAKEVKISATKAHMIVKRIEENVPKEELEKIKARAIRQK
jgi:DNA-binding Lrp family transcriptional regulator